MLGDDNNDILSLSLSSRLDREPMQASITIEPIPDDRNESRYVRFPTYYLYYWM